MNENNILSQNILQISFQFIYKYIASIYVSPLDNEFSE